MWRRVASQSPVVPGGSSDRYVRAFSALSQMIREGRSLSGGERQCAFLNLGGGETPFATVSAISGLGFPDDGRALARLDWDGDGDLDLLFVNRTAPRVRLMLNRTADRSGGAAGAVVLRLEGTQSNRDAIGAVVRLVLDDGTGAGRRVTRVVRAGEGFLSQSSRRLHFGMPAGTRVRGATVRWPGRAAEEAIAGIEGPGDFRIVEGSGSAVPVVGEAPGGRPAVALESSPLEPVAPSAAGRAVVVSRLPMPHVVSTRIVDGDAFGRDGGAGGAASAAGGGVRKAILVNVWATWCAPCLEEMREMGRRADELREAGLEVIGLNVDALADGDGGALPAGPERESGIRAVRSVVERTGFPFPVEAATPVESGALDVFHRSFFSLRVPLPLPASFLVTADGRVAAIYRGPVEVDRLLADVDLVDRPPEDLREAAVPFSGRWVRPVPVPHGRQPVGAWMRGGYVAAARRYLEKLLAETGRRGGAASRDPWGPGTELCELLADCARIEGDRAAVLAAYRRAVAHDPGYAEGWLALGTGLAQSGRPDEGRSHIERALALEPRSVEAREALGIVHAILGDFAAAEEGFRELLRERPDLDTARLNLAQLLRRTGREEEAEKTYWELLAREGGGSRLDALLGLAWLLVEGVPPVRDPDEALALLAPVVPVSAVERARLGQARAAALAAAGRREEAIAEATAAAEAATEAGDSGLAEAIRDQGRAWEDEGAP